MPSLKKLTDSLDNLRLVFRIFFRVTRPDLYLKVFSNSIKNAVGLRRPASAVIGLTYRCQLGCVHCSAGLYKAERSEELSAAQWLRVLAEIGQMGVPRVNISGGEPLLHGGVMEIVRFASERFVTVLESNGLLLSEDRLKALKDAGLACVAVSIDSADPAEHDRLRGSQGCFAGAAEALRRCSRLGLPCVLSTYVTAGRATAENLAGIEALARDTGAMAVRVMPARPVGSFWCAPSSGLSTGQERFLLEAMDRSLCYFKGLPGPRDCGIFKRNTFYVSPYGEVQPCAYLPLAFGDVPAEPLEGALRRLWAHDIFKVPHRDCLILNDEFRAEHVPVREGFKGRLPFRVK